MTVMGSGPSKPKNQEKSPPPRADKVSKSSRPLKIENNEKPSSVERGKVTETSKISERSDSNKVNTQTVTNGKNLEKKNGSVNNNHGKKQLGNFESDSESEGEDINAVLEATRNEYNSRLKAQTQSFSTETDTSYPETYAQRLQREQYRNQPQGIMRQKTIYRNPEDWEVDENETESFDVSKFKEANVQKNTTTEENSMLNRDIFTPNLPPEKDVPPRTQPDDSENMYYQPIQKKKSLPHYDTSEEALLAEIEKEFEL